MNTVIKWIMITKTLAIIHMTRITKSQAIWAADMAIMIMAIWVEDMEMITAECPAIWVADMELLLQMNMVIQWMIPTVHQWKIHTVQQWITILVVLVQLKNQNLQLLIFPILGEVIIKRKMRSLLLLT